MGRTKQPIEALIVQYFTEQPLAACESVKRIVDDVLRRRHQAAGATAVKQERRASQQKRSRERPARVEAAKQPLPETSVSGGSVGLGFRRSPAAAPLDADDLCPACDDGSGEHTCTDSA